MHREIVLPARRELVWRAIAEPERLSAWFGARARIDMRSGGRARFEWPDGTARGAVVEAVTPRRALTLRWLPFVELPDGSRTSCPPTIVRLRLDEHPSGTLLKVSEDHGGAASEAGAARRAPVEAAP